MAKQDRNDCIGFWMSVLLHVVNQINHDADVPLLGPAPDSVGNDDILDRHANAGSVNDLFVVHTTLGLAVDDVADFSIGDIMGELRDVLAEILLHVAAALVHAVAVGIDAVHNGVIEHSTDLAEGNTAGDLNECLSGFELLIVQNILSRVIGTVDSRQDNVGAIHSFLNIGITNKRYIWVGRSKFRDELVNLGLTQIHDSHFRQLGHGDQSHLQTSVALDAGADKSQDLGAGAAAVLRHNGRLRRCA